MKFKHFSHREETNSRRSNLGLLMICFGLLRHCIPRNDNKCAKFIILLLVLFIFLPFNLSSASEKAPSISSYKTIDNFKSYKTGKFPSKWRTWPFQRSKASKVYKVEEENGTKYIHAYDNKNLSVQALRKFYWPIEKYPYLSWKWRAKILPKGAKENNDATNDSACGVYVIIGQFNGHAIKYAWSTGLPEGKVVTRRDNKLKIAIKESGSKNLNKWQKESVNVLKDYKKYFNKELNKNPSGIAILTDGNAVKQPAACDYVDFVISKEPLNGVQSKNSKTNHNHQVTKTQRKPDLLAFFDAFVSSW